MARTVPRRTKIARLLLVLTCCAILRSQNAGAVEHPGVVDKDCANCHASKLSGNSVHSAMSSPCTVCHVTETLGDMTVVSLSMPKAKICSACHEQSTALPQHMPAVKGACVECHDAHSSNRRMLLLREYSGQLSAAIRK